MARFILLRRLQLLRQHFEEFYEVWNSQSEFTICFYSTDRVQRNVLGFFCVFSPACDADYYALQDVHGELSEYGLVEELHVVDNIADHMVSTAHCS